MKTYLALNFRSLTLFILLIVPYQGLAKATNSSARNRRTPSFANFPFSRETPSSTLIQKWFKELHTEALRQGIACYVDPQAVELAFPGTGLRVKTEYKFEEDKNKGYVMKIIKRVTNSKGRAPKVDNIPAPSSYICKYWVRSKMESCYCRYPGSTQPDNGYASKKTKYPVYKRAASRPSSELGLNMFERNERPEPKLKTLSTPELSLLYSHIWRRLDERTPSLAQTPRKLKLYLPHVGFWIVTKYEIEKTDPYTFNVIQQVTSSIDGDDRYNRIHVVDTDAVCKYSTKTRKGYCASPPVPASYKPSKVNVKIARPINSTGDDLDEF